MELGPPFKFPACRAGSSPYIKFAMFKLFWLFHYLALTSLSVAPLEQLEQHLAKECLIRMKKNSVQ